MKKVTIKPNFFIIGAPKSGTTALSEYLSTHPNVFFSNPKEPEFFAADFKGRLIRKESAYLRLFSKADPDIHAAIGEGSVNYLFSRVAVQRILEFQPEARFIIILRNPVELVQSWHMELLKTGKESLLLFMEAWKAESYRRAGRCIPVSCRDPKWLFYSDWGKLGSQLKRALKIISPEKIKVIVFDDFVADTARIYQEVLSFMGLPYDGRKSFPKVNVRQVPRVIFIQKLLATTMQFWLPIRARLGLKGFNIWKQITKWNTRCPTNMRGDSELHEFLSSFYANEINLLSDLLDRDFSHWMVP